MYYTWIHNFSYAFHYLRICLLQIIVTIKWGLISLINKGRFLLLLSDDGNVMVSAVTFDFGGLEST